VSDLEQFRQETRTWLEENCPASMRTPIKGFDDAYNGGRNPEIDHPDQKIWCDRMAERGWTVPHWPSEYAGGGLSKEEVKVLLESFGISMLGPALLHFGTEEQKQEHLPKIVRGEIRWCQGYSEPNAGSDLASLATRAEDNGDHYLINGQKIWTSYADKSDWIFCLVRTDNSGSKHEGISFVLFDMADPGVTTRPIKLISGSSPFCETFFDDVKAYKRGQGLDHRQIPVNTRARDDLGFWHCRQKVDGTVGGRVNGQRPKRAIGQWRVASEHCPVPAGCCCLRRHHGAGR